MLSADVGQDPGLNEYVSEEKCRQLAALSSRKRAEAAALKRAADAAALKRAAEAGDAERGNDREWKRRRSRRPLTIAGEVEASAVPAEGSGVALAKIPAEWLTVPDGPVRLSTVDRAPGLTTLEDSLTVHGFKGYRMVRATHGVCEGDWYFEATVLPAEVVGRTPSAVRLGWSTRRADVETPVASDENGYGVRDINGHFIHEARLMAYGEPFGAGDVVGCRIVLPAPVSDETRAKIAAADKDWLYFRFVSYLQGKPPSNAGERVDGAYVEFFKNGASQGIPQYFCKDEGARKAREASTGMAAGMYFPSVALFKNAAVRANFGPDFAHAPPAGSRPFCECAPPAPPSPPRSPAPGAAPAGGSSAPDGVQRQAPAGSAADAAAVDVACAQPAPGRSCDAADEAAAPAEGRSVNAAQAGAVGQESDARRGGLC
jgi:Set1/Ash2 histone methyltransferase complex subunit ASH2